MKNSIIPVFVCFIFSCNISCNNNNQISIPGFDNSQVSKLEMNDWQKDKYGCLKLRTKELAEKLIKKNNLYEKRREDFLQVFGEPNKTKQEGDKYVILIYYFDTACRDGKLQKDSDKCYANFYFSNDKLVRDVYLCE